MKPRKSLIERFMGKFCVVASGCWEWTGSMDGHGYGQMWSGKRNKNGHPCPAHASRVAYELFKGAIPDGLCLDHLCRNRGCVNPDHLEAVTMKINLLRGETLQAKNIVKTHCPKGHPYDEMNTYIRKSGKRCCRACDREWARARYPKYYYERGGRAKKLAYYAKKRTEKAGEEISL